jgi:hypothetical protein
MVLTMAKMPNPQSIAAGLTVPERILLLCLASDTDWQKAGVTHATAQHMLVQGLIERDHAELPRWRDSGSLTTFLSARARTKRLIVRNVSSVK